MKCRICSHEITPFMTFGRMPIANGFLTPKDFKDEYFFELKPAFCTECLTFQVEDQPPPEMMFHENYAFFSRTSAHMQRHFKDYAEWVMENHLRGADPLVVELGSNDGIMLENFAKRGIRHLGVEPSANVAEIARQHGVNTLVRFFGAEAGTDIAKEYGHAAALMAANVMCHIPDIHGIAKGADALLCSDGVLIFEDPYLGAMIEKTSYDQIYDEHVYIFSALSVANMFAPYGFELIDLLKQETHGGSMRYVLARKGSRPVAPSVEMILAEEKAAGLHLPETYEKFRQACESSKERLVRLLNEEKKAGRRVIGYGATSKSTTILNYCKIGPDLIEFISDTTPIKQGKFTPGMHIPVKPYEAFAENPPDTALLFAWNHKREVMDKERAFTLAGGKWICHLD
ncbi:class I SAM-dependent methyltransferase [Polynucleobacter sp. MWH-Braz-FAM2G]|uniref:class I SAM-dependent methyltransferase n=1 Tax=Polynucleobacter sp. MWH-Braz-FAM2G TaxID=1855883 RepID=UPI00203E2532|nr:class I SAM-dependent methyltransferase [Polynucleobacter sp. MWH-Braz-FAM2G]QWD91086.1 class I SAM-dependent methyltransferase [Polynucleobacter sp. MWH-Braz-FAM2G]